MRDYKMRVEGLYDQSCILMDYVTPETRKQITRDRALILIACQIRYDESIWFEEF